ncbi:MAG: Mrp/NBP35 family ATP-binding protein [Planctomycetota bacterium]
MPESLNKDLVHRALTAVDGPDGLDLVTSGALRWVAACDAFASLKVHLASPPDNAGLMQMAGEIDGAVRREAQRSGAAVDRLLVQFVDHGGAVIWQTGQAPPPESPAAPNDGTAPPAANTEPKPASQAPKPQQNADAIPGVDHIIAVGAGKGGVGKSTIAVNLAVGLARNALSAGLLDGDIYGPSLPTMLGLDAMDQAVLDGKLQPFNVHGIKSITVGKLVEAEKPLIWRGPMAHGAFQQLTTRTNWGSLERLVIDLPPGTGDIPLTMAQSLRLSGAVIVCTPQKVAQDDARRAARMFEQLGVEVLGVIENMSYFIGDDGKEYDIFGRGGAEQMAQAMGLPFLGSVPINTALRHNSDRGEPLRNFDPETAGGEALPRALEQLVTNLEGQLSLAALRTGSSRPTLTIS